MAEANSEKDAGSGSNSSLRPFRAGLVFSFFNAITWQVALGTPLVLLAERLGASAFQVGVLYSFVFLMTPVQVLSTAFLPRFGFKRVMLAGWGLRSLFLVPPILLALTDLNDPQTWKVNVLIATMFLFCLMRAVGNAAFIPWLYAILPENARGRYFANDQIFSGIAGLLTLLTASLLFYLLRDSEAFFWQFTMAFAGALLCWWALSRLADGPRPNTISLRRIVRDTPGFCTRPGRFRQFLLVSVVFAVCSAPIPPFCAYYLKSMTPLEPAQIILFTMVQFSGAIVCALVLRGIVDRFGARPFLRLAVIFYALVALLWFLFLSMEVTWVWPLVVTYFLLGVGAAAWMNGSLNYLPTVMNEDDRPLMVSIFGAVTALVGGVSPIVWGGFLRAGDDGIGVNPVAFQVFFAFTVVVQIFLFFRLSRLRQSGVDEGPILLGSGAALRPTRAFSFLINLVSPGNSDREARDVKK